MRKQFHLLALALIVALAGALRFYGLEIQPFWNDEFNTWGVASRESFVGVLDETSGVHPWGYFIVVHAFLTVFGEAEWAVRLPSAVAGFLAVPAIYALGSRLYSYREGLVAALILAVSHQPLYQSQEARMYSLLVLLVIICVYLWLPVLRALRAGESPPLGSFVGYALAAAACAYTHNFGILFVFLQGCYALLFCVRSVRALGWAVAGYGLVVLLYLPAIPRLLARASRGQATLEFTQRPDLTDLVEFAEFLFELELPVGQGFSAGQRGLVVAFLVVIGALLAYLAALNVYRAVKGGDRSPTEPTLLLWAWALGPVAAVVALSWLWTPLWQDRYLVIVLPAAYLLLARALLGLPGRPMVGYACAGVLSAVLLATLFSPASYYSEDATREQTRDPVRYVAENAREGDYLSYCFGVRPGYLDYYLERSGSDRGFQSRVCTFREARKLQKTAQREDYDYIYYVDLMPPSYNGGAQIYLLSNLKLVRTETFAGESDVYLFKVDK